MEEGRGREGRGEGRGGEGRTVCVMGDTAEAGGFAGREGLRDMVRVNDIGCGWGWGWVGVSQ